MKKNFHIVVFMIYSFLNVACEVATERDNRPNILWIVADDMGPNLGCYGDTLVYTPHIDQLAFNGIRYENCYTVSAVCSPSRSAMVTGMYPVSINCHQHRTRKEVKKQLPENIKVVTEYFEEAGYFTFNGTVKNPQKPGKEDYNFTTDYEIYDGTDWSQRESGQPFFGQIQIFMPHRPFHPDPIHPIDESKVVLPSYLPDHWIARQDWAFYLETIQQVDQKVGEILSRLEKDGLLDNTFVFFVGDQGRPMVREKQFLYDGGIHTPLIVRYPDLQNKGTVSDELISNIDLSATSFELAGIQLPDHMAGQNFLGEHKERQYVFSMRDRRDESVDRIRSVRNKRYKYIRNFYPEIPYAQYNAYKRNKYPTIVLMEVLSKRGELGPVQELHLRKRKPAEELYDIVNDPFEVNNLATDPEYESINKELSNKMDEWLEKYDNASYPEDRDEIIYWRIQMAKMDSVWKAKKGFHKDVSNEQYLEWWKKHLSDMVMKENKR